MTEHLQERVVSYVDLLTDDLAAIQTVLDEARELAETTDETRVHELLASLTSRELQTEWAVVPRQYSHADWYLLAMDRFLSFAGLSEYDILTPADREELTLVMTELDVPATFQFEVNNDENGGAYFTELGTGLRLFYWSFERKQILFNSDAITDLLVADFRKKTTAPRIRTLATLLTEFARYMGRTFDYKVDYNILETKDDFLYPLVQYEMPAGMLDRLFVLSADSDYFLQAVPTGAGMILKDNVEVRVFYKNDATAPAAQRWHFQVIDGHDAVSWLDILLDYDFIGAWYLIERESLAIASDELVFKLNGKTPAKVAVAAEPAVKVEVLQPRSRKQAD